MGADADLVGRLGPELDVLLPMLDERSRRLVLGAVARAAGEGGTTAVARVTGASWQTVADGAAELASGVSAPPGRVRRPGGGRKRAEDTDPGLAAALRELLEASTRGDPCSPLLYTTLSLRDLAGELAARGHRCGKNGVRRILLAEGFSLQANAKTMEGRRHPDRDGQFRYISARATEFLAAGDPVISVDTKKKEPVGQFANGGRSWRPAGDPVRVRDHDFPGDGGIAVPYGIYDLGANSGFVNVGADHDTPAFAVASIRRWWQDIGSHRYPGARRLLVTADAGGSNSYRVWAWKAGLAALAAETGLQITVCHFPPGTSKWNKIEHRLFCHISRTWRARPLASYQIILDTIAATTSGSGLTVTARLDLGCYPAGTGISGEQIRELTQTILDRHDYHGDWNYTLLHQPRRAPGPAAARQPAAPPGPPLEILASPALTGMSRHDLAALAADLNVPFAAAREQRLHLERRGPRRRRTGPKGPVKLTLTSCLLAAIYRYQLGMPCQLIAGLLDVDHSVISKYTRTIADLLTARGTPLTPGPHRLRTLADLQRHAAAAGITIPDPGTPPPG
jgi:Rhodopirellula transposase DDE domain